MKRKREMEKLRKRESEQKGDRQRDGVEEGESNGVGCLLFHEKKKHRELFIWMIQVTFGEKMTDDPIDCRLIVI